MSNVAAELFWAREPGRYLRVRYEDFVAAPAPTLRSIGRFVGEDLDPDQVLAGSDVKLGPTHAAWGNPNRFDHGVSRLGRDDEWRSAMSRRDRRAVAAMTLPLLLRYGYSLRDGASASSSNQESLAR